MAISTRGLGLALSCVLLLAGVARPSPVLAQGQNLAEAKCSDALKLEQDDQRLLVVWLSGYFAGTNQSPMIDPAAIRNARQALAEICVKNPETRLLGPESRAAILGQTAGR